MKIFLTLLIFVTNALSLGGGFLPIQEAFKIDAKTTANSIVVDIKLGEAIHIYRDDLKFKVLKPFIKDITLDAKKPTAKMIDETLSYDEDITIKIPLSVVNKETFTLEVTLLGCSDNGICYPPFSKTFELKGSTVIKPSPPEVLPLLTSSESEIVDTLHNASLLKVVSLFFGFGLLLALTPCIFPMIPILSSIIVSASKESEMSTSRGLFLSIVYVVSMSVAYTIAGVLAGVFGANIQSAMQNSYVLIGFSAIFVALAFSMFGFFEIQLPSKLQSRLNSHSDSASKKGGILGVAIMGFLSALIVGPCVAPALAGALIYIGQSGDALLGGIALFVMSIGMGIPLLLIGAGAGRYLPSPGGWMTRISEIFGVIMLGIAIWMLSRVLEPNIIMFLWALLLISSGLYAGALEPFKDVNRAIKFFRVFAFVLLVLGVFELIGSVSGASNPLDPFEKFTTKKSVQVDKLKFKTVKNEQELLAAIDSSSRPVMIDFTAKWCSSCKELENVTFKDPKVKSLLEEFTLLKVDITNNKKDDKELLQKYNLFGPPALIFYKDKKELNQARVIGYQSPSNIIPILQEVLR
jgi:thiol:disulfide interchange protein DsbD